MCKVYLFYEELMNPLYSHVYTFDMPGLVMNVNYLL